jgi:hypothetical protein
MRIPSTPLLAARGSVHDELVLLTVNQRRTMPRTPEEQERTYQEFVTEVRKAPNAIEILRLYDCMLDDDLENEKESFASERRLVAQKDGTIAELKTAINELQSNSFPQPTRSRWN